jgi:hypothetical protein
MAITFASIDSIGNATKPTDIMTVKWVEGVLYVRVLHADDSAHDYVKRYDGAWGWAGTWSPDPTMREDAGLPIED